MEPATILVVEDHDKNLKLSRALLELRGYRVVAARNGADAYELALAHHPALVLMDIQLPDCEGTEVLSRLRADERTGAIPVVAVTAFAMKGDRERLLDLGFDGYLSKPIDIRTFVDELVPLIKQS